MLIRIVQLDGSLPNLALLRLASFHRSKGDTVYWARSIHPLSDPFDPDLYDRVYASAIFKFSLPAILQFKARWRERGIIGGTGTSELTTVESITGGAYDEVDYSDWPGFKDSIGFTQRGCRLSCKFCVVPLKEGKPQSVRTISQLYRGSPLPKRLHLLDNDFFGQPQWKERIEEIREGDFRICLSQGINVRMITPESAKALASIQYRNTQFNERKLYTAWDNLRDESTFFNGIHLLNEAGIPSKHIMAYMLIGFDPAETWERLFYRFEKMVKAGIEPYPMLYDRSRADLKCFQRWANRGLYRIVEWPDYKRETKTEASVEGWRANRRNKS